VLQLHGIVRLLSFCTLFGAAPATALEFLPLSGSHSLNGLFGLPTALPVNSANDVISLSVNHANMFASGIDGETAVMLDGERTRLAFSWAHRLSACVRAAVELPVVAHADGYFDQAIEDWHDVFNLPNASRDDRPPNVLSVVYRDPGGKSLSLQQPRIEPGDVQLSLLWALGCSPSAARPDRPIARVGLKLPTGRLRALTGSETTDVYADITSTTKRYSENFSGRASIGLLVPGRSDFFSLQRRVVLYGTLATGWSVSPKWSLIGQLDWHTPMFDSNLRELGEFTALASVGARYLARRGQTLEFAITEDVVPDTGPDISLFLNWRLALQPP